MIASTTTTQRTGSVATRRRSSSVVFPFADALAHAPANPPSVPMISAAKIAIAPVTSTIPCTKSLHTTASKPPNAQ